MSETDATVDRKAQKTAEYHGPSGDWGSLKAIARIFGNEWDTPAALDTLRRQNKPKGFMCVSCSWAKPADYHAFEFCENGVKATLWELTTRRCTPDFFANLINPKEMERAGLKEGQMVSLVSDADDGVHREVGPLKVVPFKLPDGCIGSYYPEMNPLIALSHHDEQSKTPAAKSVPVRIRA